MKKKEGRLFVLSAPSGSGKTTILKALRRLESGVELSVSTTTRPPRPGEKRGWDYRFVSAALFDRMSERGQFLEQAQILGHRYGTPKSPIVRALRAGRDVLLGVDVQGARQIRRSGFPSTTIFLLPPSMAALRERLRKRATETPTQIQARLRLARRELAELKGYDYLVVNDRLEDAIEQIRAIIRAERCRIRHR